MRFIISCAVRSDSKEYIEIKNKIREVINSLSQHIIYRDNVTCTSLNGNVVGIYQVMLNSDLSKNIKESALKAKAALEKELSKVSEVQLLDVEFDCEGSPAIIQVDCSDSGYFKYKASYGLILALIGETYKNKLKKQSGDLPVHDLLNMVTQNLIENIFFTINAFGPYKTQFLYATAQTAQVVALRNIVSHLSGLSDEELHELTINLHCELQCKFEKRNNISWIFVDESDKTQLAFLSVDGKISLLSLSDAYLREPEFFLTADIISKLNLLSNTKDNWKEHPKGSRFTLEGLSRAKMENIQRIITKENIGSVTITSSPESGALTLKLDDFSVKNLMDLIIKPKFSTAQQLSLANSTLFAVQNGLPIKDFLNHEEHEQACSMRQSF